MTFATSALPWYVARAGGLTAFFLLTLSVLVGVGLAGRPTLPLWPRFAIEDVHRFLGLLAGVFVVVHVGSIYLDGYVTFPLLAFLVPGLSSYKTVGVAFGVVGLELLVALAISNRLRRRLPRRVWRTFHGVAFVVWGATLVHGLTTGTDAGSLWALPLFAGAAGSVAGLVVWRVLRRSAGPEARSPAPPTRRPINRARAPVAPPPRSRDRRPA